MIRVNQDEASVIEKTLQSTSVRGIQPSTLYENEFVRAVYAVPDDFVFDEFEDAVETAVKDMFPEAVVEKRVMIAHINR